MNASLFCNIWDFLHQLPWICYKTEVLKTREAVILLRFAHYIPIMVPCRFCSESAMIFEKEMHLLKALTIKINNNRIITRSQIAKYWYALHNRVNSKLKKPLLQATWRDSIIERPYWFECFWVMLFTIAWNFPEEPTEEKIHEYKTFYKLAKDIVKTTELGDRLEEVISDNLPISTGNFKSRKMVKKWIYDLRSYCDDLCGLSWSFHQVDLFYETFRARHTASCNDGSIKTEEEKMIELSMELGCK